jgi:hypothetical protein
MHIRNTGDKSLSRRLLLRCARRVRGRRTSHSDLKHRTHTWLPTPTWLPSWLPLLPAATGDSNASNWKRSPSPILRYRNSPGHTSTTSRTVSHSLHVRTFSNLLIQRRLRSRSAALWSPQAQSLGRPAVTTRSAIPRSAFRPLRASSRKPADPPSFRPRLSPSSLPTPPVAGRARYHSPPPPSPRASSL